VSGGMKECKGIKGIRRVVGEGGNYEVGCLSGG